MQDRIVEGLLAGPMLLLGALAVCGLVLWLGLMALRHVAWLVISVEDPPGLLTPARNYQIRGAPGWRLHRLAGWLYSRRTFDEVFVPVLSDMQLEYFEALAAGKQGKATWVRIRGLWTFAAHMAAQLPVSITRILWRIWLSTDY